MSVHFQNFALGVVGKYRLFFLHFRGVFDYVFGVVAYTFDIACNVIERRYFFLVRFRQIQKRKLYQERRYVAVVIVYVLFGLCKFFLRGQVAREQHIQRALVVIERQLVHKGKLFTNLTHGYRGSAQKAFIEHFVFVRARGRTLLFGNDKAGELDEIFDKGQ